MMANKRSVFIKVSTSRLPGHACYSPSNHGANVYFDGLKSEEGAAAEVPEIIRI